MVPTRSNLVSVRAAVTCLVNAQRTQRGLPALRTTALLRDAALRHSADMVRRGYFAHVTPTGVSVRARLSRAGIHAAAVGENLAWGFGGDATPATIVAGWMRSPTHRANILSRRFSRTGVGIVIGAPGAAGAPDPATITQVFSGR